VPCQRTTDATSIAHQRRAKKGREQFWPKKGNLRYKEKLYLKIRKTKNFTPFNRVNKLFFHNTLDGSLMELAS
jgi:hypothetical protein